MYQKHISKNSGITLIELMVAMAIGGIVSAAVFTVYESQVRGQVTQEVALELQQGLRGAFTIMEDEIRTAGVDPESAAGARIILAKNNELHFSRDITGGESDSDDNDNDGVTDNFDETAYPDGDTDDGNEDIRYAINSNGDLGRATGGGALQSLLDNVDALNFVYLDRAGDPIILNASSEVPAVNLDDIRQVQITIVARSGQSDRGFLAKYKDSESYRNQRGEEILAPQNDTNRRLSMTTTVTCRNVATGM